MLVRKVGELCFQNKNNTMYLQITISNLAAALQEKQVMSIKHSTFDSLRRESSLKIINIRKYRVTNKKVRPEKVNLSNSTEENECSPLLCVHVKEKVKEWRGLAKKTCTGQTELNNISTHEILE